MRFLAAADFIMPADPGSQPEPIDLAERDLLIRQALHLEAAATELARPVPATRHRAADAGIAAAAELGLALWCDDNVLRQRARGRGVTSFSVLDLTTVLRRRGADIDTEDDLATHLAAQWVADMPLTGPAIIALAADCGWEPGPAHAALARPGWWAIHDNDWRSPWHEIVVAASAHSPVALILITRAAIEGATLHARPSLRTQRYQQLVAAAIAVCHTAGQSVPAKFLVALADGAQAPVVPKPEHVRTTVADELRLLGVAYPEAVAVTLMPEVSLT